MTENEHYKELCAISSALDSVSAVADMGGKIKFSLSDGCITIKADDIPKGCNYVEISDGICDSEYDDEGYYVIADADGKGSRLCKFKKRRESSCERVYHQRLLPFFGFKNNKGCRMYIAEKSAAIFYVAFGVYEDCYKIKSRFVFDGAEPYEDIVVRVFDFGNRGNYAKMAVAYRSYKLDRGDCNPINRKSDERSAVKYAADSPEIRIRMGWKPAPPVILEQTPENEPEMHVACTFDRVSEFMDVLKKEGVEKAEICLVGWNKSGHDGRYPQLFPVEEKLGGEEALRRLINH